MRQLASLRHPAQERPARPDPGSVQGQGPRCRSPWLRGRRVLVSRKWSGKTLADHRADRKDWLLRTLGISAIDPARYAWEPVAPTDQDHLDHARRLGTEPRFVRRLIAERRIEYHKLGRHVRISEPALVAFIKAGRVEPVSRSRGRAA